MREVTHYPKPKAVGGHLIRQVVSMLRLALGGTETSLPINAHILIAVSGGSDSMALAKLLVRYGRRVGAQDRIRLLHINHGWRRQESLDDEAFVRARARRWGVPISVRRVRKARSDGRSPEDAAREQRKKIFAELSRKYGSPGRPAWILTAHHADDLAETLIWRFLSGTLQSHGGGIAIRHGQELRPLLRVRKRTLMQFLEEEGESWREDRTNFEGKLLRSKLRMFVMPAVEKLFPRAVDNLTRIALNAQIAAQTNETDRGIRHEIHPGILFSASGLAARRAHWEWLRDLDSSSGRLSLPDGWVLSKSTHSRKVRWILERPIKG